jgi:hypothetical protein
LWTVNLNYGSGSRRPTNYGSGHLDYKILNFFMKFL